MNLPELSQLKPVRRFAALLERIAGNHRIDRPERRIMRRSTALLFEHGSQCLESDQDCVLLVGLIRFRVGGEFCSLRIRPLFQETGDPAGPFSYRLKVEFPQKNLTTYESLTPRPISGARSLMNERWFR